MSSSLDNIRYLIEALRGGDNPQAAQDAQLSQRSTYNPQGVPYQNGKPMAPNQVASPDDPQGSYSKTGGFTSGGLNDPAYLDYVKKTKNPMPYMDWLEKGG